MTSTLRNGIGVLVASAALLGITACGPGTSGSQDSGGGYYTGGSSGYGRCVGSGCTNEGTLDPDGNGRFDPSPISPERVRQFG
jgi:hypothetical protein